MSEYTITEIIELILGFYTGQGYHEDYIEDIPVAAKFKNDGLCKKNDRGRWCPNEKGQIYLHGFIGKLTDEIYSMVIQDDIAVKINNVAKVFQEKYSCNVDDARKIVEYLVENAENHGYTSCLFHGSGGDQFNMKKSPETFIKRLYEHVKYKLGKEDYEEIVDDCLKRFIFMARTMNLDGGYGKAVRYLCSCLQEYQEDRLSSHICLCERKVDSNGEVNNEIIYTDIPKEILDRDNRVEGYEEYKNMFAGQEVMSVLDAIIGDLETKMSESLSIRTKW